jgi:hypothetical protein
MERPAAPKRLPLESRRRSGVTRPNSGGGKSQNNRGNPTLEEHERAHGRSGAAISGEKKVAGEPDRQSARKRQSS